MSPERPGQNVSDSCQAGSIEHRSTGKKNLTFQEAADQDEPPCDPDQKPQTKKTKDKKGQKAKSRRSMFDEELDKFNTYEEYLDSLVSDEDHLFLQDEEMSRQIAELGYRSSGDTLTRANFYKLKAKLAESRMLTLQNDAGQSTNEVNPLDVTQMPELQNGSLSLTGQSTPLIIAIKSRLPAIRKGQLLTIIFMRTRVFANKGMDSGQMEISGHIDLEHRMKNENLIPYLTGEKRLVPRRGDVTFYNWSRNRAFFQPSVNFDVIARMPQLVLKPCASNLSHFNIVTSGYISSRKSSVRHPDQLAGSGWQVIGTPQADDFVMMFDVYLADMLSNDNSLNK